MTKKLEELFDLEPTVENELLSPILTDAKEITAEAISTLEKIENALPQVKGLEAADEELDELAELATTSYKDLVDLGMNVESRFSADIFSAASGFLGHAITAKTAKVNKKLKMLDMQLKKAQMDMKLASQNAEVESTPLGEGQSLDRNELLKLLKNKNINE